jgi:hypothetical protein
LYSNYVPFSTPGGLNDPSRTSYNNFTPHPEAGKSPVYLGNNRGGYINSITTPNLYMSPQHNITTPNVMSTYEPYSPIDYESGTNGPLNSFYGENSIDKSLIRSPVPLMNSVNYTLSNYSIRSPVALSASYKNSLNSSYHRVISGYNKTYSPGKFLFIYFFTLLKCFLLKF